MKSVCARQCAVANSQGTPKKSVFLSRQRGTTQVMLVENRLINGLFQHLHIGLEANSR